MKEPTGYVLTNEQAERLGQAMAVEFLSALQNVLIRRDRTVDGVLRGVLFETLRDRDLYEYFADEQDGCGPNMAFTPATCEPYLRAITAAGDWRSLVTEALTGLAQQQERRG